MDKSNKRSKGGIFHNSRRFIGMGFNAKEECYIPQMPRKIHMPDVKPPKSSIKIKVELEGYNDVIAQLNDIECKLDRIMKKELNRAINRQKLIRCVAIRNGEMCEARKVNNKWAYEDGTTID